MPAIEREMDGSISGTLWAVERIRKRLRAA
jgi:hypothetical protein